MNKLFVALVAGFVAGILLAPDKGSVTRKKLSDGFDELSDKLTAFADKFSTETENQAENEPPVPKMASTI